MFKLPQNDRGLDSEIDAVMGSSATVDFSTIYDMRTIGPWALSAAPTPMMLDAHKISNKMSYGKGGGAGRSRRSSSDLGVKAVNWSDIEYLQVSA